MYNNVRKILRIIVCGILGYIIGFNLAECSKGYSQVRQNEKVTLNSNNTVLLRGPVEPESVRDVQIDIAKLVAARMFKDYPIYLVLDSPGGDVEAGISLIEFAKTISNLRTITISAASMAADTVESLPGSRLITNNGSLMFHRAKGEFSGQFEVGEVESRLEMAKKLILGLELANANRMGISLLEYKGHAQNEWWLNADEALQYKAADKIVDIVCSQELVDKRVKTRLETIFASINIVYSGCPTFRYPLVVETINSVLAGNN
jgi:ATP-dependent protease ClpP protease subunit